MRFSKLSTGAGWRFLRSHEIDDASLVTIHH
jgi:hypothetical protein